MTTDKPKKNLSRPMTEKELKEYNKDWEDMEYLLVTLSKIKLCKKK